MTTSMKIQRLTNYHFGDFQRALMGADQRAFDELVGGAKNKRMAISQSVDVLPVTAMLMAMIVDLAVKIRKLEKRVRQLEEEKKEAVNIVVVNQHAP